MPGKATCYLERAMPFVTDVWRGSAARPLADNSWGAKPLAALHRGGRCEEFLCEKLRCGEMRGNLSHGKSGGHGHRHCKHLRLADGFVLGRRGSKRKGIDCSCLQFVSTEVFGLGFAATCFALYTWLPSKSKGTAEQLVVQRARLPFPSDEGQSALRQVDGKSEEAQEALTANHESDLGVRRHRGSHRHRYPRHRESLV